jgi:cell division protein FtsB
MNEMDLIPPDYRSWLEKRAMLRRFASVLGTLSAVLLIAAGWLHYSVGTATKTLQELTAANALAQQQQQQLQALQDKQSEFEKQIAILNGLRAGAAIDEIFAVIDRSMVAGDLWFEDWSFRRAGVIVNGEKRGIETGYFIIVAESGEAIDQDLAVATHMTIHGQAKDHQALSTFVRALFAQSDISDVNVQKTSQVLVANQRVVDFVLTVELNSSMQES